jgi:hypothetical protein
VFCASRAILANAKIEKQTNLLYAFDKKRQNKAVFKLVQTCAKLVVSPVNTPYFKSQSKTIPNSNSASVVVVLMRVVDHYILTFFDSSFFSSYLTRLKFRSSS